MSDLPYYLGFSHFLGIGPMRLKALIKYFGDVKTAYRAQEKEISKVIGSIIGHKFAEFRAKFDPVKKMEELKKKNIQVLSLVDKDYPESLKNISDQPICVYVKGLIPKFFDTEVEARHRVFSSTSPPKGGSPKSLTQKQVSSLLFAIVGTRNPTSYGIQVARKFSYELTQAGFIIVSGMAYGIDTIVHQACLEAGGKTIAVLGCGVDIVYPPTNRDLYEKIIDSGGAVISEFPPGQFVIKGLFISRNRIISGLSRGVMIVEGLEDSGSLITAKHAAEQGKDVFAPPNPITSTMSAAPNLLLKQGAKLVTTVNDIYEEFNIKIVPKKKEEVLQKLDREEREIFIFLNERPMLVDDLAILLKKPINQVLNTLSLMEIDGVVEKNNENFYQIRLF